MSGKSQRGSYHPRGGGRGRSRRRSRPRSSPIVLYIHPAKQGLGFDPRRPNMGRPYGLMPVGVAALVNALRRYGVRVRGINYALEKRLDPAFDLSGWLRQQGDVRAVMIDLHWYEHSFGALDTAAACKRVLPRTPVILGGFTASAFSRAILERFEAVDYVIRGDAELPLVVLVRQLLKGRLELAAIPNLSYRENGQVVENELRYCATTADLDRLNFADIEFLEHHEQYYQHEYVVPDLERARRADPATLRGRWLCTARGCHYECSYCGGCSSAQRRLAGRKGLIPRSPQRVASDLERLHRKRVVQASLSYDIAELGEEYWRELFSRMTRIGLYNELFQLPTPSFVAAFARSVDLEHSCLALSPLSGSEHVRRLNGKRFSNDELFAMLELLKQYKIPIFVYFSLNLPGEDEATLRETIDLAERIYDLYPSSLLKILNSCHTLDPLSPMSEHPERFAIEADFCSFMDYYRYCRDTRLSSPLSRTEALRGFAPERERLLERMADLWDAARQGRESSWWPLPPGW